MTSSFRRLKGQQVPHADLADGPEQGLSDKASLTPPREVTNASSREVYVPAKPAMRPGSEDFLHVASKGVRT